MEREKWERLKEALVGLQMDMPEAYAKLAEIFEQQVLELCLEDKVEENARRKVYIPYMMNDAVEDYLILEDCTITGNYLKDFKGETGGELLEQDGRKLLIIRQGNENVVTVWFRELREEIRFYQYHQIGHFWRQGQEQWRQLVYIIGTIYDKYSYLGEAGCNPKEAELLLLMEFAPFRFFSPIKESLDEYYSDSEDGLFCALEMAEEAGCKRMCWLIRCIRFLPYKLWKKLFLLLMEGKEGEILYHYLWKKVEEASCLYEPRDYGEKRNEEIAKERKKVEELFYKKGFSGKYPEFYREDCYVFAAEEHPFTILEEEKFQFRIQYMISEGKGIRERNEGFFRKKGVTGRIEQAFEKCI